MNKSKRSTAVQNQKNSTNTRRRNIKESLIPLKSIYVDISNSNISSFRFLSRLQKVLSVNATNTMITDFSGAPLCSTLRQIKIQGSPISKNPNYRLMILIMLCPDIEYIDNQKVTKNEKDLSLSLQSCVQPKLYDGYIITSADPVTLSRADDTIIINENDIKESKSKNHNEIKFDQTIEMMEKLSFEISNASDELGVVHIPKLPVRELLKQKRINANDFLTTNTKAAFVNSKKDKQSSFAKAFKEYTQTPEDLVESSILFDSPEKREERHSLIMQDSPSKFEQFDQNASNNQIIDQYDSSKQIESQNYSNEEENTEQISVEQLYVDVVEPSISNKADVTVEKIFGIASEIMASPEKPSKYFEDNGSASSDLSTSLIQKNKQGNENSRIPIKLDSPSKKYGEGLAPSRLTQTKFGGYRKISDTESISSIYEEEEEAQLTATEDEVKIEFSVLKEEEDYENQPNLDDQEQSSLSKDNPNPNWVIAEEEESNESIDQEHQQPIVDEINENQEEEDEQEIPLKDMPDPDWVVQEGTENKEQNEQQQIQTPETTEQQPEEEESNENQGNMEPATPLKDMPDPDWVIQEETEHQLVEEEEVQEEAELASSSKNMSNPDLVVVEGTEDKELNEQERLQAPETIEQQPEEETNENQEELEPAPPSKDMPDSDWVLPEGAENQELNDQDQEQFQTPETIEQQPEEEETNENQEELEPAPPSKDMPDSDWVLPEGAENKKPNDQIQTPEIIEQQPSVDESNENHTAYPDSFEVGSSENRNIANEEQEQLETTEQQQLAEEAESDPGWVLQEGTEIQEQIQSPETLEQRPAADEINENQEEPAQEEEPAQTSNDTTTQELVLPEETENKQQNEQDQLQAPETTEQQQPAEEETTLEEVEPTPPSKDGPDPDWVVQEGTENKEANEQEQLQTTEQQQLAEESKENQEAAESVPPSKDGPDPDWIVPDDAVNAPQGDAVTQENPTTERSLQIENKEEASSVTEGDNYDPDVIAILDQQVQPRETVQIEGIPSSDHQPGSPSIDPSSVVNEEQQEEEGNSLEIEKNDSVQNQEETPNNTNQEEPTTDPSWIINDSEAVNQELQQKQEANPFEVSQDETQGDSAVKEEPSLDPSWVINSEDEDQNSQPPWAT